jgi:hypothetical protein
LTNITTATKATAPIIKVFWDDVALVFPSLVLIVPGAESRTGVAVLVGADEDDGWGLELPIISPVAHVVNKGTPIVLTPHPKMSHIIQLVRFKLQSDFTVKPLKVHRNAQYYTLDMDHIVLLSYQMKSEVSHD